ncbi:MAG TPA: BON domain-containing protein [Candidatus Baltobacteraceae bacterium]|jgi:osmotically-inducible protein OsmY|nr:BON domain-containing protein [Candidatus Baltobacteraceae bacterium]
MPAPIDDIELAAALAMALHTEPGMPSSILVDVSRGVVTLEGDADVYQRAAAEQLVRRFIGVKDVVNAIRATA